MSYSSEVLADTPLVYWPFSETTGTAAADASGNGRNGIHESGALPGQVSLLGDGTGASVFYDGTNDDTFVGSAAWMNNAALTIEARVQPDAGSISPSDVTMVLGRDQTAQRSFNLAITSDNKFQFAPWIGGTQRTVKGTTTVVAGTTYTVAIRYDGATAALLVNGAVDASLSVTGALATPTAVFAVGNVSLTAGNAAYNFSGRIAHVSWYATALSTPRLAARHALAAAPSALTGTLAATLPSFSTTLAGTSTPPARTGTVAAALPPFTGTLAGTSLPPGVAGTLAATLPTFSATLAGTSTPPPVTGTMAAALAPFTVALAGNAEQFGAKLTAVLPAFTISLQAASRIIATDTTYANDSYTYGGTAQVDYDTPVAPPPPGLVRRDVRRVHQSLPTPDLVRGRPQ